MYGAPGLERERLRTQTPAKLGSLQCNETASTIMLGLELAVKVIFKAVKRRLLLAGNGYGRCLALGRVDFDVSLERVVVDVIYRVRISIRAIRPGGDRNEQAG